MEGRHQPLRGWTTPLLIERQVKCVEGLCCHRGSCWGGSSGLEICLSGKKMVQWLRICLPMQVTQVRSLVGRIPHAGAGVGGQLSPLTTITEPVL